MHLPRHMYSVFFAIWVSIFLVGTQSVHAQTFYGFQAPSSLPLSQLRVQKPLGDTSFGFVEFSGTLNVDDPLDNFFGYLMDPVNWDPTESVQPRTAFTSHSGLQSTGRFFGSPSSFTLGVEAHIEQAQVNALSSQPAYISDSQQRQNLIDVMYSPYVSLQTLPLSWIRILGTLRVDALQFDVHRACPRTCSLEPNGQGKNIIPSVKGQIIVGPWLGTNGFVTVGSGFQRFGDREPARSTAEQQLHRTQFIEIGFNTEPADQLKIQTSLWRADIKSDGVFVPEDDGFMLQGPSRRYGLNVETQWQPLNWLTLSGELTWSKTIFREPKQPIPFEPGVVGKASIQNQWNNYWSTNLRWQYVGKRVNPTGSNRVLTPLHTFDVIAQYQLPLASSEKNLTCSLGILNLTNRKGAFSQFTLDSGIETDPVQAIDLNYFPGQSRMVVGGLSWSF